MIKKLLFTLIIVLFQAVVFGATNTYTGANNGNWNTATNWSTGIVPTASDDVVIPSGISVILSADVNASSVTIVGTLSISNGADLKINSPIIVITSTGQINFAVKSIIRLPSNVALYLQNGSNSLSGSCNNNDEIFVGSVQYGVCTGGGATYVFQNIEDVGGINNVVTSGAIGTSQTICNGSTPGPLTSTTAALGSGTITYEWQTNTSGVFVTISSATSESYSPTTLSTTTSYKRRTVSVFGTNTSYSAYTAPVIVAVNPLPNNTLSSGFTGGSFCIGSQATLTFDADDTNGAPPYTLSYSDGTTTYSQSIASNAATTFNVSATTSKVYTLKSITNANGCINLSPANLSASVTFRPNPTATVSGSTVVCLGATSPNITFTNPQAAGITVIYTINGGANQTVIVVARSGTVNGTANIPVSTTIAGSFVYALVSVVYSTNPSCTQTVAGSALVTVSPLPSAPAVTVTQPTCTVATGSISISAVSGETYSFDGSAYSGTLVYSSLVQGSSHTVYAKNASGCISLLTPVTLTSLVTNTYTGTWSAGSIPPVTGGAQNIVFNTDFTSTTNLSGCSCQVNAGVVIINSGNTLTITDGVNVYGGSLTFEDGASLVQVNNVSNNNSGNITYNRLTANEIDNFDYTYWSSPVSPQKLINVSPSTSLDKFYSFDLVVNDWKQEDPNNNMINGVGYIIRGPQTNVAPAPAKFYQAPFKGVPNNGGVTVVIPTTTVSLEASALLGNPYPSALDADLFLIANKTALEGTLYFWTHNTNIGVGTSNLGSGAYAYTSNDYASYNLTGGTTTRIAAAGINNSIPNGKIASGQGFFAAINPAGGTVSFNNSMRLGSGLLNNSQFFKLNNTKSKLASSIEKDRVWLNLFNSQGAFKQTLIGYITEATNEYDSGYDGETFDGNEFVDFYSVNQDKNLVIQGRAVPFNETDEVPLGYKTTIAGDFIIAIAQTDGLLAAKDVFLEDKITKLVKKLKDGAYNFSSEAGTFNDRFLLRFKNSDKTLGIGNFETVNLSVLVSNTNKQIKINSSQEVIDKILVYDVLRRLIYQKMNVNATEFVISSLLSNRQAFVVKIVLKNGQTVSKKIIY